MSTFAGSGSWAWADGVGTSARLYSPNGITLDSNGALFVGDWGNNRIRKISSAGEQLAWISGFDCWIVVTFVCSCRDMVAPSAIDFTHSFLINVRRCCQHAGRVWAGLLG